MTKGDGKPCVRCGTSEWNSSASCKQCGRDRAKKWIAENKDRRREWYLGDVERWREYSRNWYNENKERASETNRRYREEHKEELAGRAAKWYRENPGKKSEHDSTYYQKNSDKIKDKVKEWNAANPDRVRERTALWRRSNRDKVRVWNRRWEQNNPDKVIAKRHKRRAAIAGAGGSYTDSEWNEIKELYDHTCLSCGRVDGEVKITVDHVVPVTRGGSSNPDNLQPLCLSCNSSKGIKIIDYRPEAKEPG